jgi:S1-C subfamily serine protease
VNWLDVAIVVVAVGAAVGGWRLGFVARLFAWAGVAVGLAIGIQFVPDVVTSFGGTNADDRVTVALLFLVLAATIGQAIGLGLGLLVHRVSPPRGPLPAWDRAAGAALGAVGVLVLVWMVIPSLAAAKGWPARLARDSFVVNAIEDVAPDQPAQFAAWGRAVSEAPYPSALSPLDDPPDPGRPPTDALPAAVDARARASTVKVRGNACRRVQEGTGWVAAPGLVVTNAHVVAGEDDTTVEDERGNQHSAQAVAFDPVRDLAVLSVPGMDAAPLPLASGAPGDIGAVYGHPGGGPLEVSPARIGEEIVAVGTDIYRTGTSRRRVYVLAAALEPGDSGGPFVDTSGRVLGVAFAIDPARNGTSYALTDAEVRAVLETAGADPVSTGGCLVG